MQDVDALLAELRAAGGVDSEGHFSLDAGAAREKLAQFRLPHPAMWPLPFVSAAMWANATRLSLRERVGTWTVEWDAITDIDDLPAAFKTSGVNPQSHALRLALEMVGVLRPERVTLHSARRVCEFRDGQAGVASDAAFFNGTRVVIEPGELWRMLRGFIFESVERVNEAGVLRTAAAHASMQIFVNDGQIPINAQMIDLTHSLTARILESTQALPASDLRFHAPERLDRVETDQPLRALLWIPSRPLLPATFTIVVSGLSFEVDPSVLGLRRVECVVAAPYLEKDLSQTRLLLDDSYQTIIEEVSRQARSMLRSLALEALSERDGLLLVDLWQSVGEQVLSSIDPQTVWLRIAAVGPDMVKRGQHDLATEVIGRMAEYVRPHRLQEAERAALEIVEAITGVLVGARPPSDPSCLVRAVACTRDIRVRLSSVDPGREAALMARQRRAERRAIAILSLLNRPELAHRVGAADPALDNVRALAERLQGRLEAAERRLMQASERAGPTESKVQSLMYLAEISLSHGHLPLALLRYRNAMTLLDERSPALRIALLEGFAEALHAAGELPEAIRVLEMAIHLRHETRLNEENELTLAAMQWRTYSIEAGHTFVERSKVGRWLHSVMARGLAAGVSKEAASLRPLPRRLDEAIRLSQTHPSTALEICRTVSDPLVATDGWGAEGLELVYTVTARLYRQMGNLDQADVHRARRHLISVLRWSGTFFTIL